MTALPLCLEAAQRGVMTDDEFWHYVFNRHDPETDPEDELPDLDGPGIGTPCPICGEAGACSYDTDGRPLIHAIAVDEDADA